MRRRIFSTDKKSSSILIIGALIPSSGLFVLNSLFLYSSDNSEILLLYFQSVLAVVFGAVFFAPAWGRMPLKTEGEFIPYRFIGRGAVSLARFRGLYLGLLILPLAMAVSIQPLSECLFTDVESQKKFTLFTFVVLTLNIFFNSLKNRIRIDSVIGYSTILVALCYFIFQIFIGEHHTIQPPNHLSVWMNNIHFKPLLLSIVLLWWFATIVDLPDMRGQLLLTLKNGSESRRNMIIALIIAYFIQGILLSFPLLYPAENQWSWISNLFIVFVVINAFQAMFSTNHWTASLIYAGVIRPLISNDKNERTFGMITMFVGIGISALWLAMGKTTAELFGTIFLFTAGVGPAFALRWFWSRINAFTIMSAMLGAPVVWVIWMQLKTTTFIVETIQHFQLDEISVNVIIPGIINTLLWLIVMVITYKKEEHEMAKIWIKEIDIASAFKNWKNWALFIVVTIFSGLVLFGPSLVLCK